MTQKMCDKAVNTYPSTVKFVPESYKTQERCNKAVNSCFFVFDLILGRYKNSKNELQSWFWRSFWKVYCPDQCKTQKMCDKAVDYSLEALNLTPNWFVAIKMIK